MTTFSFTSGELLDIISTLEEKEDAHYAAENRQLAVYYMKLVVQFQRIYDRTMQKVPEERVAVFEI